MHLDDVSYDLLKDTKTTRSAHFNLDHQIEETNNMFCVFEVIDIKFWGKTPVLKRRF